MGKTTAAAVRPAIRSDRIAPPEEEFGGNRRLSIVFFHHPNYDTVVECLPTCTGPGGAPKYGPVTVADYYVLKREQHKGAAPKS